MKTLIFCLVAIAAQAQFKIQGFVRSETNLSIPFSTVLLLNAKDSSLVKGAVAGENGNFLFENIKAGRFVLSASMVAYQKKYSTIFEAGELNKQSMILVLPEESKSLKEVVVVAKKPLFEQQIDKLVVNVENSVTAAGGTALEVLELSPGITVNKQNNSMTMSGKSGVMVMLNGKLTRLPMETVIQMLDGMSASTIEKIELITTPSAKYDAEGDAGIINIVTKKNLNFGTNGSFSGTFGYGWYERPTATLNLNHRNEKLNIYGDYTYSRFHAWQQFKSNRNIQKTDGVENTGFVVDRYPLNNNHSAKVGFDYNLSQNTTFSGLVSAFNNHATMQAPSLSSTFKNNMLIQQSLLNLDVISLWQNLMLNLSMRHIFKNKQEWSIDVDKLFYSNNNPSNYTIGFTDFLSNKKEQQLFKTSKKTPIQFWVIKTDFLRPINTKGKLEFGLKFSTTTLRNDVEMERNTLNEWIIDSTFTQHYKMAESIEAAYTNFNYQFTTKTSIQAGLRYESTQTDINTLDGKSLVHRRYGNLFPSVFFSHKLSKSHTLNLSYARRVTRPSYNDLAPFVIFGDLNTFFYGNEKLLPTISDAVQASYTLKDKYILSVKYSHDKNRIVGFIPHPDVINNRLNYYAENMDGFNTVSVNVSTPVEITKWWQSQNNFIGNRQHIVTVFQNTPVNRSTVNFQLNSSHTFKLPNKFTAELTFTYNSPQLVGFQRLRAFSQVTAGLQKILPNNKGTLRLNISDIFWKNYYKWATIAVNLDETGHYIFEPRVMRLTYSRSFGNQKVKAARKRTTGSEEERQRL